MSRMIPTKKEWENALEKRCGRELKNAFLSATVAICGLGGLGSNIAVALSRAGVGKLILIDFDRVDITNINRQQYKANQIGMYKTESIAENLKEIAPYIVLETITEKITEENAKSLLSEAQIICEAFDSAEAKAALANLVLSEMPDKYLISSSGMAGLHSANDIHTRKITNKFYLCGDEETEASSESVLFSSRVMLCAAHQAHMVLRIIANKFEE